MTRLLPWNRAVQALLCAFAVSCTEISAQPAKTNANCVLPASLRDTLQTRHDLGSYTQAGAWFDAHRHFACAAQEYRLAARLDPKSAHLMFLLGNSLLAAGDIKSAEEALRQSTTLAPSTIEAHESLAVLLEQAQRKDEAKTEWNAALTINNKSPIALDGLARHLLAEGNYAAAITLLRDTPLNETLALDLAQAYGRGASLTDAEATVRTALVNAPDSFPLTRALIGILVDLGRFQEASTLAEKYAEAHSRNLEAQSLFLHILVTTNDTVRARPLAKSLLLREPRDAYFLYVNGRLEREAGDFASARSHLQDSIALDPNFDDAHYHLGLVLAKFNDLEGAVAQFEKAIALGAQEPEIRFQLSKVLRSLGRQAEADRQLKLYRETVELESKRTLAQGKAALAEKELAGGDVQRAIALYREALDATPDDALLNFKLGMALDKASDIAGERDALDRAVQIDRDMAIAQNQLGYLAARGADTASAEAHFREAVRAAPAYAEAWVNLAATLATEAKFAEAQQAVASALKADPSNAQALQLQKELSATAH